jgi:hypothetical protein
MSQFRMPGAPQGGGHAGMATLGVSDQGEHLLGHLVVAGAGLPAGVEPVVQVAFHHPARFAVGEVERGRVPPDRVVVKLEGHEPSGHPAGAPYRLIDEASGEILDRPPCWDDLTELPWEYIEKPSPVDEVDSGDRALPLTAHPDGGTL